MKLKQTIFCIFLLVAVTAVGCRALDRDQSEDDRGPVIAALAARADERAENARYAVDTFLVTEEGSLSPWAVGEGIADFAHRRYRIRLESGTETLDIVILVDVQFERRAGESWRKLRLDREGLPLVLPEVPLVGGQYDGGQPPYADSRSTRKRIWESLITEIQPLGTETLRGAHARGYRVFFDRTAAERKLPRKLTEEMQAWDEPAEWPDLRIWLDDRDRLRKLTLRSDEVRVGYELWDYNRAPKVQIPKDLKNAPDSQ